MKDIVTEPTRNSNTLDHVIISRELCNVYKEDRIDYDCPIGTGDHKMLTVHPYSSSESVCMHEHRPPTTHRAFDYRKSNIDFLIQMAQGIDWIKVVNEQDVNKQWENLEICIKSLMGMCIPCHEVKMTEQDKEWMTHSSNH